MFVSPVIPRRRAFVAVHGGDHGNGPVYLRIGVGREADVVVVDVSEKDHVHAVLCERLQDPRRMGGRVPAGPSGRVQNAGA